MTEVQDIQPKGKRMTRRTVAQGAAWAVPVIAIGAPVPAMAASPPDVVFELDPLLSCKYPGKSCSDFDFGYRLVFRVRSTLAVILFISAFTAPNGDQVTVLNVDGEPGPDGGIVANSTERNVAVVIGSANSANGTATITLTTQTGEVIIRTVTISDFHPCDQDLRGLCP
jgi:hypothetical protein